MELLSIVVVILLVGLLLWTLNSFVPIDKARRNTLNAVVTIVLVLGLVPGFRLLGRLSTISIGQLEQRGGASPVSRVPCAFRTRMISRSAGRALAQAA